MYPAGSLVETRVNMWSEIEYESLKQKKPGEKSKVDLMCQASAMHWELWLVISHVSFRVHSGMFHYSPFTAEKMHPHRD